MAAPTMKSTSILTEHLQYPAISLVDDIINAVNEVMYKCTAAMEKYLMEKSMLGGKDYSEEIRIGIAKLESILEQSVDKNFDKLELYVLRNVLRIPQELLDANVFRLSYQRNLVIPSENESELSQVQLEKKVKQVEDALRINQEFKSKIKNAKILKRRISKFKDLVVKVFERPNDDGNNNNNNSSAEFQQIVESLTPLDDSLKLVTLQLRQLYVDTEDRASTNLVQATHQRIEDSGHFRADYIDKETHKILGVSNEGENRSQSLAKDDLSINSPDLESLRHLTP